MSLVDSFIALKIKRFSLVTGRLNNTMIHNLKSISYTPPNVKEMPFMKIVINPIISLLSKLSLPSTVSFLYSTCMTGYNLQLEAQILRYRFSPKQKQNHISY